MLKKRSKISLFVAAITLALMVALVGCGGSSSAEGEESVQDAAATADPTTLFEGLYDLTEVDPEMLEAGEALVQAYRSLADLTEKYYAGSADERSEMQEEYWNARKAADDAWKTVWDLQKDESSWNLETELFYNDVSHFRDQAERVIGDIEYRGKRSSSDGEVSEGETEFVGTWQMTSMEDSFDTYTEEDITSMEELGTVSDLVLNEDGTASLSLFFTSFSGTWEAEGATMATCSFEGEDGMGGVGTLTLMDDTLTLYLDDIKMTFARTDGQEQDESSAATTTANSGTEESTSGSSSVSNGEVDPAVREFCDSYEAFIDEYVAFMQRYNNAGANDQAAMMNDYLNMMARLGEMMEKEEAFSDAESTWNEATVNYYTEVMLRCSQKMLEAY